jgi:Flp pilus assembly protein TadB
MASGSPKGKLRIVSALSAVALIAIGIVLRFVGVPVWAALLIGVGVVAIVVWLVLRNTDRYDNSRPRA